MPLRRHRRRPQFVLLLATLTVAAALAAAPLLGQVPAGAVAADLPPGPPASVTFDSPTKSVLPDGVPIHGRVTDLNGHAVADNTPVHLTASGTGTEHLDYPDTVTRSGEFNSFITSRTDGRTTIRVDTGTVTATTTIDWLDRNKPDLHLDMLDPAPVEVTAGNETVFSPLLSSSLRQNTGITATATVSPGAVFTWAGGALWSCSVDSRRAVCHREALGREYPYDHDTIGFGVRPDVSGTTTVRIEVTPDNGPDANLFDNVGERSIEARPAPGSVGLARAQDHVQPGEINALTASAAVPDGTLAHFVADGPAGPYTGSPFVAFAPTPDRGGYWLLTADGHVTAAGTAPDLGDVVGAFSGPAVSIRATPSGRGFLVAGARGEVVGRGDAAPQGSPAASSLPAPVTGLALTATGRGYWLTDADGDVFPFGDAGAHGDLGHPYVRAPIAGIETSPGGAGYWLWSTRGDVYPFGDAPHLGGRTTVGWLNRPVTGMALAADRKGFLLVDADGRDSPAGPEATYSSDRQPLGPPIVAIATTVNGTWLLAADGSVLAFGDAPVLGPRTAVPFAGGAATVPFTSFRKRTSKITAWVDKPGGAVVSTAVTATWQPDTPLVLTAASAQRVNGGTLVQTRAIVSDSSGQPVPDGRPVTFTASGTGHETPASATVSTRDGMATFTFTADSGGGRTTVTASAEGHQATAPGSWQWQIPPLYSDPLRPHAPVLFEGEGGDGSVRLRWSQSEGSGVTGYVIDTSPPSGAVHVGAATTALTYDGLVNGNLYTFTVTPLDADGPGGTAWVQVGTAGFDGGPGGSGREGPPSSNATVPRNSTGGGYWMLGAGGAVYSFGTAAYHGAPALAGTVEAVDLEPTPSRAGYWILDSAGAVHAFGNAAAHGDVDRRVLAGGERVASLSATPTGGGYWVFTNRGRALAFGDAAFLGDMAKVSLAGPVLDSIPTPSGKGYYMVASDGGIFAFGDAHFDGSMGGRTLNAPVQSLVPDSDGSGYWLVASDGGIFAFDAPFRGSMGGTNLNQPVKGMVRYGTGYLMVAGDGGIFAFSDKPFAGSLGGNPPSRPIVAVAAG